MDVITKKNHEYPIGTKRVPGERYTVLDDRHATVHTYLGNVERVKAQQVEEPATPEPTTVKQAPVTRPHVRVSKSFRRARVGS